MNKRDIMLSSGLVGICIGACVAAIAISKHNKETVKKEVEEQINVKIKKDIMDNIDFEQIEKDVKRSATEKVADKMDIVDKKVSNKLNIFEERLQTMEDIDAKKMELAKVIVLGLVSVGTTFITAYYSKHTKPCDDKFKNDTANVVKVMSDALLDLDDRLTNLEVE